MSKIAVVLAVTTPLFLVACGGGGGSSASPTTPVPTTPTPTTPTPTTPSGPKAQTINALSSPYSLSVGSSEALSIVATSALPVSYTNTTPSICSISSATLTGLAIGTCNFVVSQSGDANFTAAPSVTYSTQVTRALLPQTISSFSIPALSVDTSVIVSPSSTSGLPIKITSLTPSVCFTQSRGVIGLAVGACTLQASQSSTGYYADALPVSASVAVVAANSSLATNAVLGSWMTTPESGSTALDSGTNLEGLYINSVGDQALIDGANNFIYNDSLGLFSGVIQPSASTWAMSSSSLYYTDPNTSFSSTASGSFVAKQSLTASAQSFTTDTVHLSLIYDKSNGYAASQSSVVGTWIFDNGVARFVFNIDSLGVITGTEKDVNDGVCNLSGHIVQTEPTSQHNLYQVTLSASGASCTALEITEPFTGFAAMRFSPAGTVASNGYIPSLSWSLLAPTTKSRLSLLFY